MRVHGITDKVKKLTKQEVRIITRIFLFCAALIVLSVPARGENLYFVTLTHIKEGKEAQFDRFATQIAPIWQRHGIAVLMRTQVLDALTSTEYSHVPSEIAVLTVNSREGFNAYLEDPDYQRLQEMRLDAVERMVVLEAVDSLNDEASLALSTPLVVFLFHGDVQTPPSLPASRTLSVIERGPIKGQMDLPIHGSTHVTILGLSYDDNPLSFLHSLPPQTESFIARKVPK